MTGHEFLRKLRVVASRRGVDVRFVAQRGKGSHGTVYVGSLLTIIPDLRREMKAGMVFGILKQLGISRAEWMEG